MPYLSSSHHSDGLSLMVEEELGEEYVVAGSPSWSSSSSQITPSLVSSSDLSPRPTLSSTSSPSHIPPSAPSTPSMNSRRTVGPVAKEPSLATLRDMLLEQREQIKALWDGHAAANQVLDETRQRKEVPQDSTEIREHLHAIERRLEMLLNRQREVEKESTTDRRHEDIPGWTMRAEVASVPESSTDLESLHRRWSDLARAVRIHAPAARPSGPSLEFSGAPLPPGITGIQQPPPLIPSVYQPSRRSPRSTSTSSVIPGRSTSAPPFPDMGIFSPETLHHPPLRHTGMRPALAPRAERHILPPGQIHPSPQDPMLAHEPYPMGPPPMGPPVVPPTITIGRAPPVMPVPGAPATGPIVIQLNPPMALPQSAIPSHPPSGADLRSPREHGMMEMPASPHHTHRSPHPEHFAQSPPEQPVIAPGSPSTYTHQEPRVVTLPTRTCPIVIQLAPPMALPQPVIPSHPPSGVDLRSPHEHGMMEMPTSAHHTHRSPHPEHFPQPPTEQPVIAPGSPSNYAHQEPRVVTLPMWTYDYDSDDDYTIRCRYYNNDEDDYYYPRRCRCQCRPYYDDGYDYLWRRRRYPDSDEDEDKEDPWDPRRLCRRQPPTEEADLPHPTQPGEPQVSPGERDAGTYPATREVPRTPVPLEDHDEGAQLPRRPAVTEEEPPPPRCEEREAAPHEYETRRPERKDGYRRRLSDYTAYSPEPGDHDYDRRRPSPSICRRPEYREGDAGTLHSYRPHSPAQPIIVGLGGEHDDGHRPPVIISPSPQSPRPYTDQPVSPRTQYKRDLKLVPPGSTAIPRLPTDIGERCPHYPATPVPGSVVEPRDVHYYRRTPSQGGPPPPTMVERDEGHLPSETAHHVPAPLMPRAGMPWPKDAQPVEQAPYNVQGYLDEFSKALAIEVRMLLREVGKLREERRTIQHEVGSLMMMRTKYSPGGEFHGDWQAIGGDPLPDAPPPPQDATRSTANLRTTRRIQKQNPVQPPEEEPKTPSPRLSQSWATWLPNPAMAPTPPSVSPTPDHDRRSPSPPIHRRPEYREGDAGTPHSHRPHSPAQPTINSLGGKHDDGPHPPVIISSPPPPQRLYTDRPVSPLTQYGRDLKLVSPGDTTLPRSLTDIGERCPHYPATPVPGSIVEPHDVHDYRRTPSRSNPPPPTIVEGDEGRPPSEIARHIPLPPMPERGMPGPEDAQLIDALREQHERLNDTERELAQIVHEAHDTEGRRDDEFRSNEEARQQTFLDNEAQRNAEARQQCSALLRELEEKVANVPLIPVPPPRDADEHSLIESISTASYIASHPAADVLEIIRGERELLEKEREANAAECERARADLEAERQRLNETREARIHELEEELNRVRAELDNGRQLRMTEADEARSAAVERDEALCSQLAKNANFGRQNHACCEENKAASEERWREKQHRKTERDGQIQELLGIVARVVEEQNAAKQREEDERQANEGKPGIEQVLEDLARQNAEQRELLYVLSETWRTDNQRQHEDLINAVRATANEQVPYNVQGYLHEFCEALVIDVRMILGEVGKLREERRAIQHEVGSLMMMRAKYSPGGEFDGDWQAMGDGPPPDAPPQPQDATWSTVNLRTTRRIRKQSPVQPPEAELETPQSRYTQSWATWLPNPTMVPTPPPVEPTRVVPDRQSPGLLGPWQAIDAVWSDRTTSRIRKQKPVQPRETEPEMPPSRYAQSWATWLPNPAMAPTPPSAEPTPVVSDRQSPGLFGPRSPRDSFH